MSGPGAGLRGSAGAATVRAPKGQLVAVTAGAAATATPGTTRNVSVGYRNLGPATAAGATRVVTVPAGANFISAAAGGVWSVARWLGGPPPGRAYAPDPRNLLKGQRLGPTARTPYLDSLSHEGSELRLREGTPAAAILKMAPACSAQPLPSASAKP